jgi:hypothetical protein
MRKMKKVIYHRVSIEGRSLPELRGHHDEAMSNISDPYVWEAPAESNKGDRWYVALTSFKYTNKNLQPNDASSPAEPGDTDDIYT